MRFYVSIFFIIILFGCKTYKPIKPNEIKAIYTLYKGKYRYREYTLFDSSVVKFDIKHSQVKIALEKYKNRLDQLRNAPVNYLDSLIINKRTYKPVPVKILPLREFGYVQTHSGKLIFYGIGGAFIDLTNSKVYYGEKQTTN